MSFIIASDIHGSAYYCKRLAEKFVSCGAKKLILLGDLLYHGPRNDLPRDYSPKQTAELLNALAGGIIAVRGNCDSEVDQMMLDFPMLSDSALICAYGITAFAVHGHKLNEQSPPLSDGDILLYGHTHIPEDKLAEIGGRRLRRINPGSVSIPKNGSRNQCLLWDENGFAPICLDE